ncbi:MAG: LysM peptidoglycan-binding domain-containing protein [Sedimentisphaerales bacterium]|jgi:nucleoid-associated protein YgaU
MTTDAKIGLLLALVFIVAITFVINGLPDFLNKKDKSQDTVNYVSHYKPAEPGIVGQSRNIAAALNRKGATPMAPAIAEANIQLQQPNAAYQTILPAASEVVNSVSATTATETVAADIPATTTSVETQPVSGTIYEVTDGDRLSDIAIKFYGPKEGKKFANVQKIYEANKKTLKSIDSLQVGQKIVIPSLDEKEKAILKTGLFEKVAKETKPAAATAPAAPVVEKKASKPLQEYVIKEQDTLWKIAAKFLGDGNRYEEIASLNESVIKDPENLVVGTKIKIPAK